jgi:hypothetical protein
VSAWVVDHHLGQAPFPTGTHAFSQGGLTALHLAASKGELEATRLLLEKGANKEAKNTVRWLWGVPPSWQEAHR